MDPKQKMAVPLGYAIKVFRGCKRLTQTEMNRRFPELQQSYLSKVESGELFPSGRHLEMIVECLGVSNEELWRKAEELAVSLTHSDSIDVREHIQVTSILKSKLDVAVEQALDQLLVLLKSGKKPKKEDLDRLRGLVNAIPKQPIEALPVFSKHLGKIAMDACRLVQETSEDPEIAHSLDEEIVAYSENVGRLAYAACETLSGGG